MTKKSNGRNLPAVFLHKYQSIFVLILELYRKSSETAYGDISFFNSLYLQQNYYDYQQNYLDATDDS